MLQIVGAGAVGMLLTAYFNEAGFPVQLVTRRQEQAALLNMDGLSLIKGNERFHYQVTATSRVEPPPEIPLMVIAVKSYDLKELEPILSTIDRQTPLLFIQNGLSQLEFAQRLQHQKIAFGSIEHGALKLDDRTVEHTGIGLLRIAIYRGEQASFKTLLNAAGPSFPIVYESDAELMLLRKAFLNALINPLTAILQVRNGELLKRESRKLMETLYDEMTAVFPEMKEKLPFKDVIGLCRQTAENRSSMLSDRQAGRKTETDAITGALLRMAGQREKECPTLRAIHLLMKSIEEGADNSG